MKITTCKILILLKLRGRGISLQQLLKIRMKNPKLVEISSNLVKESKLYRFK